MLETPKDLSTNNKIFNKKKFFFRYYLVKFLNMLQWTIIRKPK